MNSALNLNPEQTENTLPQGQGVIPPAPPDKIDSIMLNGRPLETSGQGSTNIMPLIIPPTPPVAIPAPAPPAPVPDVSVKRFIPASEHIPEDHVQSPILTLLERRLCRAAIKHALTVCSHKEQDEDGNAVPLIAPSDVIIYLNKTELFAAMHPHDRMRRVSMIMQIVDGLGVWTHVSGIPRSVGSFVRVIDGDKLQNDVVRLDKTNATHGVASMIVPTMRWW